MANYRNSVAEINLRALESNYKLLLQTYRQTSPQGALIPMVKANAYGHGDFKVAQTLERLKVPYLGVALVEEGVHLRTCGIRTPILVFGQVDSVSCEAVIKFDLTPVLSHQSQIECLKNSLSEGSGFPVHLKFNTGMQRLGFEPEEARSLASQLSKSNHLKAEGICTHLLSSEDSGEPESATHNQIQTFGQVLETIKAAGLKNPFVSHVFNSGGIFKGHKPGFDLARPGISLYGCSPAKNIKAQTKDLIPVMSLKTQLAFVHKIKKGATVSYGGTWKASVDSTIGVIPLGYADGIPRVLSNKGSVLISGKRAPIVGIVCMDYFMVDLTNISQQAKIGDEIVVFGTQNGNVIAAEDVAEQAGSISYEILTGIQSRVPRIYLE